jgi:RNA polymerase sigma-70 factor (ECF subfamily)
LRPVGELDDNDAPVSRPDLDARMDVDHALTTLSARQRLAVDCYYFADLSIADTAAVMGCSEGTVKSTLSDARARLRTLLEVTE